MRNTAALCILLASMLSLTVLGAADLHAQAVTSDRYVDATGGDDSNDGTTPQTAWKTLSRVNAETYGPGARILFKAGEAWTGRLAPQGSGSSSAPIEIGQYGTGSKPLLQGAGVDEVIYLYNQEYWEIRDLEITNTGPTVEYRRAIYIVNEDAGALHHLHLKNLEVHDVNSALSGTSSRYYGGIFLEVIGSSVPSYFDGVLIEGNHVYDVDRTGISNQSSWWRRSRTSEFGDVIGYDSNGNPVTDNWVPSENIVIRDNLIERTGGNGIIVRVSKDALVESNTLLYTANEISGNAAFCFNTDGAVFQFNEAAYTVYNDGDTDARGIDSDYRTKDTIIQYNYLHHNGKGGVVATGGPGGTTSVPRFNDGTIIRYNILVENEQMGIRVSGKLTNLRVHNNVFYTSDAIDNLPLVEHGAWSGAEPDFVQYYSNIFYHAGNAPTFDLGGSTNVYFRNNIYHYGSAATNQPGDPYAIFADPRLVNPSPNATVDDLSGFQISPFSPAVGTGVRFSDQPAADYFGGAISSTALVDIGAHQLSANRPAVELAAADAHVRGGSSASTNYGSSDLLHLKANADDEYTRVVYLKFDPAQAYSDVTSVRLRLLAEAYNGQNARIYFVSDDTWSESGITWDNRPATSTASRAQQLDGEETVVWDVTDLVKSELEAGNPVSLAIEAQETTDQGSHLGKFYSREEPSEARKGVRPALLIDSGTGTYAHAPAADAYVRNGTPSTNYGSDDQLRVKAAGSSTVRHTYVRFAPDPFAEVESARLRLYMTDGNQRLVRVRFVSDDTWTESGITWDNKPAFGSAGATEVTGDEDFESWDVTDLVEADLLAGDPVSLGLESLSNITSGVERYVSKEGATGSRAGLEPVLIVEGTPTGSLAMQAARVEGTEDSLPVAFTVSTYPNPAAAQATLAIDLPDPSEVEVTVFDVLGRTVRSIGRTMQAGRQKLALDVSALAAGMYFIRVKTEDTAVTRRLVVVK